MLNNFFKTAVLLSTPQRLPLGIPIKISIIEIAYVASVSNRVIARKLERKQKKGCHSFFCSCPSFLDELREETLATQASALFNRSLHTEQKQEPITGSCWLLTEVIFATDCALITHLLLID